MTGCRARYDKKSYSAPKNIKPKERTNQPCVTTLLTPTPTQVYKTVEEIENVTSGPKMTFVHLPTTLKCSAMEEVGVVHLLRDIQDYTVSSLATQVCGVLYNSILPHYYRSKKK